MPTKHQVTTNPVAPVSAHAWNVDRSQVAISPNDNSVDVLNASNFSTITSLSEDGRDGAAHEQRVTAIDWAPNTNRIVTAGQDRNAYVWDFDAATGKWKPMLVILRINRAATCVKWSPNENKFAVGSGARLISVCYFEKENNWWVSKHIKKPLRSTVLCLDWHPNNCLLAAGSSDFKARIFSAFLKGEDEKPSPTVWGKKMPFNEVLGEFSTGVTGGGWVHGVAFSGSGDKLAFVAHDSSVTIVDGAQDRAILRLETAYLPFRSLLWTNENTIVAAGHDYKPFTFKQRGSEIVDAGTLDVSEKKATKALSAMDKFKTLDRKGSTSSEATETSVNSTHQNAISEIRIYAGSRDNVTKFSTAGMDGQIVIWDAPQ